jgi:hypothetical protein
VLCPLLNALMCFGIDCFPPNFVFRWGDALLRSMLFETRVTSKVEYSSGSVVLEYGLSSKKEEEVTVIDARRTLIPRNNSATTNPQSLKTPRPCLALCPLTLLRAGGGVVPHPQGLPGVRLQRGGRAGVSGARHPAPAPAPAPASSPAPSSSPAPAPALAAAAADYGRRALPPVVPSRSHSQEL